MANRNVKYCDLHTHTTASDGQYTPTQLVYLAAEASFTQRLPKSDWDSIPNLAVYLRSCTGEFPIVRELLDSHRPRHHGRT